MLSLKGNHQTVPSLRSDSAGSSHLEAETHKQQAQWLFGEYRVLVECLKLQ
jgi:hypothetical protein